MEWDFIFTPYGGQGNWGLITSTHVSLSLLMVISTSRSVDVGVFKGPVCINKERRLSLGREKGDLPDQHDGAGRIRYGKQILQTDVVVLVYGS